MTRIHAIINGKPITAEPGMTILQAARANGIYIPTLCDHPALSPFGACRVCLVEAEKNPKLLTSCTTPITEGMVVHTNTPRVIEARKAVVELILVRHPLDCFSCSSNGKCELQEVAYELGIKGSRFADPGDTNDSHRLEDANPFYVRDMDKCILCGRCVRACDEQALYHAIDFQGRGINTSIQPPVGSPLEESDCVFCGQCVQVCPVGALYEKPSVGRGRPWELKKVTSACSYCGVGCELEINVNTKTGKIAGVTTDYSSPTALNKGRSCVKGRFAWQFVHSEDRLTAPLVREDGAFRTATWDEALSLVANKLSEIKSAHGPDSLAFFSSARCTNEENYLMQRLAREVFGTNNVDHCARLCHSSTVAGLAETIGSGAMTNDYESIRHADVILIIGSNTTETHPVIGSFIKERLKKGGCTLIVCDPRKIEMAKYADIDIRQKSGSDVALLNGMMHVILRDGLHDAAFIEKHVNNFEKLKETVAKYTPEYVAKIAGVAPELIEKAARAYAKGPNSAIFYTMGITQHITGTNNVRSVANLALLCGMLGRPGTGVNPLRGQNNVQGACDMGCLPNVVSGYRKTNDPATRAKVKELWGRDLPETPGRTMTELMDAAAEGGLKAAFIMGENGMVSEPDTEHVRHALKNLDFLVVQDIFLTETAELADVVLPAACWGEKDGTYTSTCRAVQRIRKAVDAPGEARPDWEILLDLAKRLGAKWEMNSPEAIFDDLARITPQYAGMSYGRLENAPLCWPCPTSEHPGTPVLYTAGFPRGKADFSPCEWLPPHEWPDEEYPFLATTGRLLYHYHTGSMTRRSAPGEFVKEMFVEVAPADARALECEDGDTVRVSSRRGSISAAVKVTDRVPTGMVFLPFHFAENAANTLTSNSLDPVCKIPGFKVNAVKVEKAV